MAKTPIIKTAPKSAPRTLDEFVEGGAAPVAASVEKPGKADGAAVKRLTIDLPAEDHKRLRIRAASEESTMVEVVRRLISEYLDSPHA